jgi:signal peptidase I
MMFALFMIVILLITGLIWLFDSLFLQKKRASGAKEPIVVEYAKSFFPVILIVFLVRSFIVEPFKIPSGSMMPTLLVGDYILVNKFTYGLRVPIINNTFIEVGKPARGDVFVFHYPPNPSMDYIKRVVGLPGDKIRYENKTLVINGVVQTRKNIGQYEYIDPGLSVVVAQQEEEQLGDVTHQMLIKAEENNYLPDMLGSALQEGQEVTVPAGHYFAMGDNRDNSADSRVWGFVPEQNLVGKAFFIWMNFGELKNILSPEGRIGTKIQ